MNRAQFKNLDAETLEGFGDEWERFDQSELPVYERERIFNSCFSVFPCNALPSYAEGFDLGSGRVAKEVAPRVAKLHCIDSSSALAVAKRNLVDKKSGEFKQHQLTLFHLMTPVWILGIQ